MGTGVEQGPALVTGGSGYLAGFVQGPALGPAVSGSLELPLRMLTGRLPLVPRASFCGMDTRDAAELHIKAPTDDRAREQRIIAAGAPLWFREIAATLNQGLAAGESLIRQAWCRTIRSLA